MRLLILGGSGFLGRAAAELAISQGHHVTTLNRGTKTPVPGVRAITADRTHDLSALDGHTYDAVIDTWSAAAPPVHTAAQTLSGRAGHYTYVSSISVYADNPPTPTTETAPLHSPDGDTYPHHKTAGEHAATTFHGPVLLARAGLILGPGENIGRLPWWLNRLHRGGPTLAPGPADHPLALIDARDLAQFLLDSAAAGRTGPYNLTGPPGQTTMGELLDTANHTTGNHADLRWLDPHTIHAAGIQPWTELPIWLPPGPDHDFAHHIDVTKALNAGLTLRPVADTITDTWTWMQNLPGDVPQRPDRPTLGLDPVKEQQALATH